MTNMDAPSALVVHHVSIYSNVRFGICKLTIISFANILLLRKSVLYLRAEVYKVFLCKYVM